MAISESVLDIISGKAMADTSTQLLDNTLATIDSRIRQKQAEQLHTMRNQQIKQASAEMAEWQRGAYNRELEARILEHRNARALETVQETMDREEQMAADQAAQTHFEGMQARFNTVINSTNNSEYQ
jgi:hypothetical protein